MSARQYELPPLPDPSVHTIENFMYQWGRGSGFEREEIYGIFGAAQRHYTDLPYHNFDHAKDTLWEAMRLADLCEQHGESVNRKALIVAALFHDAGFHDDHKAKGFESKEKYSAAIMADAVSGRFGLSVSDGVTAIEAILATEAGVKPETLEQKILVRADLANVFADTRTFLASTIKLYTESQRDNRLPLAPGGQSKFIKESGAILRKYFSNDLWLGDWDDQTWLDQAKSNLSVLNQINRLPSLKDLGATAINRLRR